jgi:outer membrane protein assembly factor BamD
MPTFAPQILFMRNKILYIFLFSILLVSCSGYEKLLKSTDNQLKFEKAKEYYEKKEWTRAITLLDAVAPYYKGTEQSEEVLYLTAQAYYGNEDYYSAATYYSTYTKTFARGKYAEDCWYMIGYCHYKESPDARLDQTATIDAINAFDEFLQIFPNSSKVNEANKYLAEMHEKLAYKAYLSAKLYFDLGNYLGNNYLSAIITANNTLKENPNSKYKEELAFIILKSKFKQAELSVPAKKADRYRETVDEYYNFINEYPKGEFASEAQEIFQSSKKFVKE